MRSWYCDDTDVYTDVIFMNFIREVYVVPFSFSFSAESDRKLLFSVSAENILSLLAVVSFSAVNVKPFSVSLYLQ